MEHNYIYVCRHFLEDQEDEVVNFYHKSDAVRYVYQKIGEEACDLLRKYSEDSAEAVSEFLTFCKEFTRTDNDSKFYLKLDDFEQFEIVKEEIF